MNQVSWRIDFIIWVVLTKHAEIIREKEFSQFSIADGVKNDELNLEVQVTVKSTFNHFVNFTVYNS